MSRSCQRATSSRPAMQVAPQDPGQARQPLGRDRVALVGHGRRALLPGLEPLLDLAHLGALEVAQLRGDQLDAWPRPTRRRRGTRRGGRGRSPGWPGPGCSPRRRADVALRPPGRRWSRCPPRPTACRPRRPRGPSAAGSRSRSAWRPTAPPWPRTWSARRGCRGCARPWPCRGARSAAALSVRDQRVGRVEQQVGGVAQRPAPARCPPRRTR